MRNVSLFLFGLFLFSGLNAQSIERDVIASAGGYFENDEISISWTLGEVITETVSTSDNRIILTQGFQQPDNVAKLKAPTDEVKLPDMTSISMSLFPNPTTDNVYLTIKSEEIERVTLDLVDMNGRILYSEQLDLTNNRISNYTLDISRLPAATYMVLLTDNNTRAQIKNYKVQKMD